MKVTGCWGRSVRGGQAQDGGVLLSSRPRGIRLRVEGHGGCREVSREMLNRVQGHVYANGPLDPATQLSDLFDRVAIKQAGLFRSSFWRSHWSVLEFTTLNTEIWQPFKESWQVPVAGSKQPHTGRNKN